MKKIVFLLLLVSSKWALSQQSFSSNFINDVKNNYRSDNAFKIFKERVDLVYSSNKKPKAVRKEIRDIRKEKRDFQKLYRRNIRLDLPVFGISGIGNINQESLSSLNASGKISLFARPVQFRNNAITIFASYNKNASNNDSVIYEKLIFPEIGSSSFNGTIQFDKFWKYDDVTGHVLSPFLEFGFKKISSDSSVNNQKLRFSTLTYTAGVKYTFGYSKLNQNDSSKINLSFFAIPYVSVLNIPNEDTVDYKALVARNAKLSSGTSTLTDNICTAGIKIGFQINNLQVYADFRNVLNKRDKIPVRELQGFHANIGIVFNADVFEFRK
jgi:hypothetical protein